MRTDRTGLVAVPWSQIEIDGLDASPIETLCVGAVWSWRGQPAHALAIALQSAEGAASDDQLLRAIVHPEPSQLPEACAMFELSNGSQQFSAELVNTGGGDGFAVVFRNGCPVRDQEFWISAVTHLESRAEHVPVFSNIVRFPGARLREHDGPAANIAAE